MKWSYTAEVKDGEGVRHILAGVVEGAGFLTAAEAVIKDVYLRLTGGETVFGKPGQGRCRGPYQVLKLGLEREE